GNPAGTRIVGVLPPSFKLEQATDLWRPTRPIHSSADFPVYFLLGRRRADVSLAAVQTAMSGLERRNPPPVYAWRGPDPEWKPQVETLARAGSRGRCDDRCCCCWRRRGACCCWAASTWRTCWWRATISGGANLGCGWRWAVRGSVGGLGGCMGRAAPIVGGGCGLDAGGSDARAHGPARGGAGLGDAGLHRGLGVLDAGAVCAGSGTGG